MSEAMTWAEADRHRLVRLCALISGSWSAAEDLAQETLLEAYRNEHKLRDAEGRSRWLAAIARNVCLRWARTEARHLGRCVELAESSEVADSFDLEVELEREELARLLDRAMALLSEPTREVLVRRFVEERAPAEIAEGMGISADAVSMRISRGKLQLRRVLETELRGDAQAYGFLRSDDATWRATKVSCPQCGRTSVDMSSSLDGEAISFQCTACVAAGPVLTARYSMTNPVFASMLGGLARPTAILNRTADWVHEYFVAALSSGTARCTRCGRPTRVRLYRRDEPDLSPGIATGVYVDCDSCREEASCSLGGLALSLPEVRSFRQQHKRIRALDSYQGRCRNRTARVVGYGDVESRDRVEVFFDEESAAILDVQTIDG